MDELKEFGKALLWAIMFLLFLPAMPFAIYGMIQAFNPEYVVWGLIAVGVFTMGVIAITWGITASILDKQANKEHQRLVDHFVEDNRKKEQELTERYEKKLQELRTVHENYIKMTHERGKKHDK
jgi:F0F1-type ATP synthase membrane subunit b/b'